MMRSVFLAAAEAVSPLLRSEALATRWDEPSVLALWPVSGLAGHLGGALFNVERFLAAPLPPGTTDRDAIDAVTYYMDNPRDHDPRSPINRLIREYGEQAAGTGPADLAARFDDARRRLAGVLAGQPADRLVLMFDRAVVPLGQCLLARLIELVVHADDLAASLRLPMPELPAQATDLVLTTLTRIAQRRHGTVPVLRALARRERQPPTIAVL